MRPAKMTHGSASRSGMAATPVVGAVRMVVVINNTPREIRVPIRDTLGPRSRSDFRPKSRSQWRDRTGFPPASAPEALRVKMIRRTAPLSNRRLGYVSIGIFVLSRPGLVVFYRFEGRDHARSIRPGEAHASGIAAAPMRGADNREGAGQFRPFGPGF